MTRTRQYACKIGSSLIMFGLLAAGSAIAATSGLTALAEENSDKLLAGVLDAARSVQQDIPPLAYEVETSRHKRTPAGTWHDKPHEKLLHYYRRMGELIDNRTVRYNRDISGKFVPTFDRRSLWNGQGFFHRQGSKNLLATFSKRNRAGKTILFTQETGAFLDGRFKHNTYAGDWITILENAQGASIQEQKQAAGEHPCYRIAAETRHGDYDLLIDPAQGYNIMRAHIVASGEDLAWGRPVSEVSRGRGRKTLSRIEMQVADVEVGRFGDRYFPVAGRLTTKLTFSDGSVEESMQVVRRGKIQFDPDFGAMGAFVMDLPEGTEIRHEDVPGIRHRWLGGKVVPDVDELVMKELERTVVNGVSDGNKPESGSGQKNGSTTSSNGSGEPPEATSTSADSDMPAGERKGLLRLFSEFGPLLILIAGGVAYFALRKFRA
ncbi:MAG: hypothetical protein JSU94_10005 [Phycisphaerales bacterium]|nr:MAG: hypothetical protein JSU94_10005 [Phycisphaerales bacterium]